MEAGMLRTPPTSIDVYDRNAGLNRPRCRKPGRGTGLLPEESEPEQWEPRFKETGGTLKALPAVPGIGNSNAKQIRSNLSFPQYWSQAGSEKRNTNIVRRA
jgi:hypothetical protein